MRIQRRTRLYKLTVTPVFSAAPILVATGGLKSVVAEACALLPGLANYDKVRRELNRVDGAWASMARTAAGVLVLVTIIWTDLENPPTL